MSVSIFTLIYRNKNFTRNFAQFFIDKQFTAPTVQESTSIHIVSTLTTVNTRHRYLHYT